MEAHHLIWFALGQWAMIAEAVLIIGVAWRWRARGRRRSEAQWERLNDRDFGEMHHLPGQAVRTMHQAGIGCCPLGHPTNGSSFSERKPPSPKATETSGDGQSGRRTS